MNPVLYNAAVSGDIGVLVQNKDKLVIEATLNKNSVLHLVCQSGKTECVREILSMHSSLLQNQNSNNDSTLHVSARNGHYDVAIALIEFAVKRDEELEIGVEFVKEMLRMKNKLGDTALLEAVRYNHLDVVNVLIHKDPEFSHVNDAGETPLYIAAEKGYEDLVTMILQKCTSPPPSCSGSYGRTALHGAIISNSEVNTRILLNWKQSLIKKTDENGWSPLHYATFLGYEERVLQLLDVDKSLVYDADNDGNTCLHVAAYRGLTCVADVLIKQCPDCWENVNSRGENILHIAVKHKQAPFVSHILREYTAISNTLITGQDVNSKTPLHLLADSNCIIPELNTLVDKNALNNENLNPSGIVNDGESSQIGLIQELNLQVKRELVDVDDGHLSLPNAISNFRDKRTITKKKVPPTSPSEQEKEKLRRTADAIMIVATLITTVTFTAAFTMPGGYNQSGDRNPGMAVLSKKTAFQAFIISDTLALLLSVTAIFFNFWGILYGNEDKLYKSTRIAVIFTVGAIVGMLLAFSTGSYVVLAQTRGLAIAVCFFGVLGILYVAEMFSILHSSESFLFGFVESFFE